MTKDTKQDVCTLANDIDETALNATNQIVSRDRAAYMRSLIPTTLILFAVVPNTGLVLQFLRWAAGYPAWSHYWLLVLIPLTFVLPLAWLFFKVQSRRYAISRHRSLREVDQVLGATERIETADDFLRRDHRDGFMQAAVEDATQWVQRGRDATLSTQQPNHYASQFAYSAVASAVAATILAAWLAGFARVPGKINSKSALTQRLAQTVLVQPSPLPVPRTSPDDEDEVAERPRPSPDTHPQKTVNRQGSVGSNIPNESDDSQGKLSEGETRESQQSANPSSARGTPSSSGQPSKSGEEKEKQRKKNLKKKDDKDRKPKERQQEDKPSGATAGQGSSKGSDNSAAPSDWASTSQAATPDDEDAEEEDEVDDEEEEQESRGGVQPNMRDRRTPANRDLQIGFGSNRPNPDANGRGGPGGQKKSRGVASLVLGVPIPDRVNGQPNKGRIRITQQRITPEAEQSDVVDAQDRLPRNGAVGPIHHPDYSPWLMDIVRRYFLDRRAKSPLNRAASNASANTTSESSKQTSRIAESNNPQS